MIRSLLRSLIALAAVTVAYQLYALTVTPWVEPPLARSGAARATDDQWDAASASVNRYQRLLSAYFPPGHWSLTRSPKVIENGSLMLVLEDYKTDDRGGVDLTKCAVIAFTTRRIAGEAPPRDAVVFEAPAGAQLRFDEAFNPTRGRIGRLVEGYFPGELVVRSDMKAPGDEDDLWIATRDLRFRESIFFTDAEVRFRLGAHQGSGRRLETRLIMDRNAEPGLEGPSMAGVSSLELRDDVRAEFALGERAASTTGGADGALTLTSEGPFRFDFTTFVASFQQRVQATLPRAGGPSDQLLCGELRLHFAGPDGSPTRLDPDEDPDLVRRQTRMISGLEPFMIEAVGNPVRVDSALERVAVRGRRLKAWLIDQRFRIEGAPASLAYGHNEVQAGWIDYSPPPEGSRLAVGDLSASGPGWLRATPREDEPERVIETRWSGAGEMVRLARNESGAPVLMIQGDPEVAATGVGKIASERLMIRLREIEPDGPDGPAIEFDSPGQNPAQRKLAVLVERIDALGSVRFRGRELEGTTNNLVAWFQPQAAQQPGGGGGGFGSAGDNPDAPVRKTYRLAAGEVQVQVGLFGRRSVPMGIVCHRGVRFEESPTAENAQPLRVSGEELRVDNLHQEHALLTVAGATDGRTGSNPSAREGLAQIEARGLRLWASDLHVDQAASRVWSEGPGDARVRLDRRAATAGLEGEATLRWSGGMEFDGQFIRVRDEVFGEVSSGWLHCAEMVARLSEPIDLTESNSRATAAGVDIAEVECVGGVTIDQRTSDVEGQLAHDRAQLATLKINQQTGAISGKGPGWVRSVRLTDGDDPLARLPGQTGPAAAAPSKLRYLRVNFQRGLTGNLHQKAIRFEERVRGVYGPVLAWEQELPVESPGGLSPDSVALACDALQLSEDPAARYSAGAPRQGLGPLEARAIGMVRIEGVTGDQGASFTAEGASASYTQLKEIFVLEGDASRSATLWVRKDAVSEPARSVARKISYDRRTGRVKAEDIRGFDYQTGAAPMATPR